MLQQVGRRATLETMPLRGYQGELLPLILQEMAPIARQAMLDEVACILQDGVAHVLPHTEPLVWAVRDGIDLIQRPDDCFMLRWGQVADRANPALRRGCGRRGMGPDRSGEGA